MEVYAAASPSRGLGTRRCEGRCGEGNELILPRYFMASEDAVKTLLLEPSLGVDGTLGAVGRGSKGKGMNRY